MLVDRNTVHTSPGPNAWAPEGIIQKRSKAVMKVFNVHSGAVAMFVDALGFIQ